MAGWRYYRHGRTRFCWSTTPRPDGKYRAWKQTMTAKNGLGATGLSLWFNRRKTASARAYQWYETARRASRERASLNSTNLEERSKALSRKAERLRARGDNTRAANLEIQAGCIMDEIQRQQQSIIDAVGEVPDHLKTAVADAAEGKQRADAKANRVEKIEETKLSIKRWTRKFKLAKTKLRKLTQRLKRLEKPC